MNLLKRLKTLWILSGWDLKNKETKGAFQWTGIVKPQNPIENPKMAQIIKRKTPAEKFLEENK